ncbi:MAG TPA: NAD(P)-binding domain-containing protein, partial [Paraburkholderia sp.]|nr:NAD(P)-binding domain-containing protein [Paraburkholderia sp.]
MMHLLVVEKSIGNVFRVNEPECTSRARHAATRCGRYHERFEGPPTRGGCNSMRTVHRMKEKEVEIGFCGPGLMGAPMIRHLLGAGHAVQVWNRTRAKAEALVPDGAT